MRITNEKNLLRSYIFYLGTYASLDFTVFVIHFVARLPKCNMVSIAHMKTMAPKSIKPTFALLLFLRIECKMNYLSFKKINSANFSTQTKYSYTQKKKKVFTRKIRHTCINLCVKDRKRPQRMLC